jgi:hypothetical protein
MKKFKFAFLSLIAIAGCVGTAMAQSEETRQVSGFTGITSSSSFSVHVKIDGTESLRIKAEPQAMKFIETYVEHGMLEIRVPQEHNWSDNRLGHVDIYITARSLSSLSLGGSGSIEVEGIVKGENVHVSLGGSGSISSAVESGSLRVSVAGSGSVKLHGKAAKADITISGSGNLKASELKLDDAEISIAGSGDCYLDIEKTISAHIAGSGNVRYTGNATITNVSSAGSGRVTRVR